MTNTNKRGRKPNPNKTKSIYIDSITHKPIGKGRPSAGRKLIEVTVQQSIKNSDFDWNSTPYSKAVPVTVQGERVKRTVPVKVIMPELPTAPVIPDAVTA